MPTHEQKLSPESFEFYLEIGLEQEYNQYVRSLIEAKLLVTLPECGEKGIVGIDGNEYPIPSLESIKARLKNEDREKGELKRKQGFKLQMTPFALPIELLAAKLGKQILKHHAEGKLLATKASPTDPDEPLELDTNQPLSVWNKWIDPNKPEGERGADVSGECVYHPESFDQTNHHGHTKQQILDKQREIHDPWAGWEVKLIEANPNIPREGKGQTKGNRKQLGANQTPEQYQKLLQTDSQYQHEQGLTNEDWITQFLIHLEQTNQVIDNWDGNGSATFLPGSFSPASGLLGYGDWDRDVSQADLGRYDPGNQFSSIGLRSAVGLGRKLEFED